MEEVESGNPTTSAGTDHVAGNASNQTPEPEAKSLSPPSISTTEKAYLEAMASHNEATSLPETNRRKKEKGFDCRLCGQNFPREVSMKDHLKVQHGVKNAFACLICNVLFPTPMRMRVHLQNFHETFNCAWCPKSFSKKCNLHEHEQNRHQKSSLKHRCKICGKWLSSTGFLRRHVRNFHKGVNIDEAVAGPEHMSGVRIKTEPAADVSEDASHKRTRVLKVRVKKEPFKRATVKEASLKKAPVPKVAVREAPVNKAAVKEGPVKKAPVKKAPVKEASMKKAAVKVAPVKKEPVIMTPVSKASVKKAAIKKAPTKKPSIAEASDEVAAPAEESFRSSFYGFDSAETFECDSCSATFELRSELSWHKMTEHRPPAAEIQTNVAKRIKVEQGVEDGPAFRQTPFVSPRAAEKDFKCGDCQKIFASQNYLDKHKKSAHPSDSASLKLVPDLRILKCEQCCKFFVHQSSFDDHVRNDHKESQQSSLKIGKVLSLTHGAFESSEMADNSSSFSNIFSLDSVTPESDDDGEEDSTDNRQESPSPKRDDFTQDLDIAGKGGAGSRKRKEKQVPGEGPSSKKRYYVSVRNESGYSCHVCSKIFHHNGFYLKHMRLKHQLNHEDLDDSTMETSAVSESSSQATSKMTRVEDPVCLILDKAERTPSTVRNNLPRVKFETGMNLSDSIKCLTCNKSFRSNNELVRHMQEAHVDPLCRTKSEPVAMSCGFCCQTFESSQEVVQHIKDSHQHQVPPADGSLATMTFSNEVHVDPLADPDPSSSVFVCADSVCKKIFVSQAALEKHAKAAHRNRTPKSKASRFTVQAIKRPVVVSANDSGFKDDALEISSNPIDNEASLTDENIDMSKMKLVDPLAILQQGLEEINKTLDGQGSSEKLSPMLSAKKKPKFSRLQPTEFVVIDV